MAEYRERTTGKVIPEQQFRSQYSNVSFPDPMQDAILDEMGYDRIRPGVQPSFSVPYQYVYRNGEEQISGIWTEKWSVGIGVTADIDASVAYQVRGERDSKLAKTDWLVIKSVDTGVSMGSSWTTYRQELRDLPNSSGFPHSVTWPTEPSS